MPRKAHKVFLHLTGSTAREVLENCALIKQSDEEAVLCAFSIMPNFAVMECRKNQLPTNLPSTTTISSHWPKDKKEADVTAQSGGGDTPPPPPPGGGTQNP